MPAAAAIAGHTRCVRPPCALAAFEIAVRRRRAALARLQPVGVHRQAHRAARLAPFEAGVAENLVQAFALGLLLDQARSPAPPSPASRSTRDLAPRTTAAAARRSSMRELVQEPMNTLSMRMSVDRRVRLQGHVVQRLFHRVALDRILFLVGIGHAAVDRRHHLGRGAPGDLRLDRRRRSSVTTMSNFAPGVGIAACASTRPPVPIAGRLGANGRPLT